MISRPDDDALSWEGDDDPTLTTGPDAASPAPTRRPRSEPKPERRKPLPERAEPLPQGFHAVGKGSDTVAPAAVEQAPLGNAALVAIGMIAAAYLLFAIGWLIAGFRLQAVGSLPVPTPTLVALTLAAAIAPLVWFGATYALTRRTRTWVRFVWLIAGLVLLVPWPFLGTGTLV